ncbi:hypothetical protein [Pelagerythrobacter sp.]|uniref:hypothetical protein n=1 Tax=Pelagerythrobacter sp. TaxID=2800702 RepID=UPI0035B00445
MHWITLPLAAAAAFAGPSPSQTMDGGRVAALPAEYRPCSGSVPVFNAEACDSRALTVEPAPVPGEVACRDRIREARAASGQPGLDSEPAKPGEAPMIAAVDKRIDGCAVMQMHRDVNDIRPLPAPPEKGAKLLHKLD